MNIDEESDLNDLEESQETENEEENVNFDKEEKQTMSSSESESAESIESECNESEGTCPICFESYKDRSLIEECLHSFCFECVKQWSKQSKKCPLCKREFGIIIHQIRNDTDFEVYKVENNERVYERVSRPSRRVFGATSRMHYLDPRAVRKRRDIYIKKLRAKHVGSNRRSNYHSTSHALKSNSEISIRIAPWIERELVAILNESDVDIIKHFVISTVKQFGVKSEETVSKLSPFLFEHTERFLHELACFIRSPFKIDDYDRYVQYKRE